jgi:hypothetical protein
MLEVDIGYTEEDRPVTYIMGWPCYEEGDAPEYKASDSSKYCNHEFVNIGFYSITMACKYCGTDQQGI